MKIQIEQDYDKSIKISFLATEEGKYDFWLNLDSEDDLGLLRTEITKFLVKQMK